MSPHARIHEKSNGRDVGFDISILYSDVICARSVKVLRTGIRAVINTENIYLRLTGRSGLTAAGYLVQTGVIDPDYVGEIKVVMFNQTNYPVKFNSGARIAQLVPEYYASRSQLYAIDSEAFESIKQFHKDQFPETRGEQGFGSSGIQ